MAYIWTNHAWNHFELGVHTKRADPFDLPIHTPCSRDGFACQIKP